MLSRYSILYRRAVSLQELSSAKYGVFVSAYNPSDRVTQVFDAVNAHRKVWAVHEEYRLRPEELPIAREARIFAPHQNLDEAGFCSSLLEVADITGMKAGDRLCIDLTGFMRPHLMYLIRLIRRLGVISFDCVYSEPKTYTKRERTQFSKGGVRETRQIRGFEGVASPDSSRDLLIIGVGYDDKLISEVAQYKDSAKKVMVLGFPSLRADMYQQNLLRVADATEALGDVPRRWRYFAPAYDPFVTADTVSQIVHDHFGDVNDGNLYLSPLATKAQALGFALYFEFEGSQRGASILFPFSNAYERETGRGLARTWRYVVEFP